MQNGSELEWELMSLYGTALGDTLSLYHFAMSSDVKYEVLSNCAVQISFSLPSCVSNVELHTLNLLSASTEILQNLFKPP